MRYLTLDYERNKFRFVCPIFNSETSMASCVLLRNLAMSGKPGDKRRGCQACIMSGKCPAAAIVSRIIYGREVPDDYGSETPIVGKLRQSVLNRVHRVIVQEKHMSLCGISDVERKLIATANERIAKMLLTAPKDSGDSAPRHAVTSRAPAKSRKSAAPKVKANETVMNAAMTGDMTAAINAEV